MMINDRMPEYCVDRLAELLNERALAVRGAKVLQLGMAYKQDIDDFRESPAIEVNRILRQRGAQVSYFDPYLPEFTAKGEHYVGLAELTDAAISEADIVIITTAHTCVDYRRVPRLGKCIFDTKNAMSQVEARENIFLL